MFLELKLNATESENAENIPLEYLSHVINDGEEDIHFSVSLLDTEFAGNYEYHSYITVKPGESFGGFKCKTNKVFFRSVSGVQPIRVAGLSAYEG